MLLKKLIPQAPAEYQNLEIKGITCDSRKVEEGFAFVCIDGTVADGHNYAKAAEEKGAAVIICQKPTGCKKEIIFGFEIASQKEQNETKKNVLEKGIHINGPLRNFVNYNDSIKLN